MEAHELQQQVRQFIRRFGLLDQKHTPCGQPLPTSQAHALQLLGQYERLTQQELAAHLNLEKSTISRLVKQMVQRGWIQKSSSAHDRRAAILALSPDGQAVLSQVQDASASKFQKIWDHIPSERHSQVVEALEVLVAAASRME